MSNVFQITSWDETPYIENQDGSKKSHAKITQSYSGVIEGSSEIQYLMSYQSAASALFVGFEVVTGKVNGKSGSFTLQHNGKFENGVASSNFLIVSGTDELANIEGSGSFKSGESGQANYELTTNA
ncbi:DUF3224 domain-containing protein (plasmid) [Pseudoalteromonas xiamenensis]|uniref:DUF3224 domain-containing protein n=1 Tax=Pseudoalteromonas xiamenensis TaxID=882626 RepID=UPI0027E51EBC|nr:DUF3224 domain-containing protein [Pseudoalteromonas xiamenensis]WMN62042.1 DUF3224 domain-containing protein [Pseudoalteromonas xiamenensis]